MKSFFKVLLVSIFIATPIISFADDDSDWQHQPANGGSYSNDNNGSSSSNEDSSDRKSKSLWNTGKEILHEVKKEYDNTTGNSDYEKAADISK